MSDRPDERTSDEPGVLSEEEHVAQRESAREYAEQVVAEASAPQPDLDPDDASPDGDG